MKRVTKLEMCPVVKAKIQVATWSRHQIRLVAFRQKYEKRKGRAAVIELVGLRHRGDEMDKLETSRGVLTARWRSNRQKQIFYPLWHVSSVSSCTACARRWSAALWRRICCGRTYSVRSWVGVAVLTRLFCETTYSVGSSECLVLMWVGSSECLVLMWPIRGWFKIALWLLVTF
jgi:hypothetical protein